MNGTLKYVEHDVPSTLNIPSLLYVQVLRAYVLHNHSNLYLMRVHIKFLNKLSFCSMRAIQNHIYVYYAKPHVSNKLNII